MTPNSECQRRLDAFRETLGTQGLDGAVLVHATDVFYLSGTRQNAALWVPAAGDAVLLVRKSLERARLESPLADVRPFSSSKELAAALGRPRRVGFTFDVAPGAVERFWARALGAELADVSAPLRVQRSVKSAWELDRMRETAQLLCGVFGELPAFLHAGMRELDLAAEIECRMRKAGNEGSPRLRGFNQEFFMGLALAAGSATAPSYFDGPVTGRGLSPSSPLGASVEPIPRDVPILLDYTAMKSGYVTDMTRIAVCGRLAPELARAFEVALAIQEEVARSLRPGAIPSELWGRAKALAEAEGLSDCFMGPPGAQARFVGHGVGLELDELPVLAPGFDVPLQLGQVLAVEPKFVLPGLGAIGIENTWAVADAGGARLTELPDTVVAL
ncbi:Xaa-Pro peptidase family protein [Anaeromyxobacter sp. Fw109-5]|uniref:M24 family metallopeptidase n=1 Tax=Anaeromyxobacter sp. (strain Fw109-5) TaxID=404589 RepID=UPI0000ED7124|nr:Xaa-Pro peptidase family protein [Anaeromyxobacter sp. Fw109-5]ABS27798.1 peptidase M24 [Anaeromyxobacter sp. Fw109-5]